MKDVDAVKTVYIFWCRLEAKPYHTLMRKSIFKL